MNITEIMLRESTRHKKVLITKYHSYEILEKAKSSVSEGTLISSYLTHERGLWRLSGEKNEGAFWGDGMFCISLSGTYTEVIYLAT